MMFIKNLKDINKNDIEIVGGKAASLGEIIKIGVSVPSGFVLLSSAFDRFLKDLKLDIKIKFILKEINYKNSNSIVRASRKIRRIILNAYFPKDLAEMIFRQLSKLKIKNIAVRSSATVEDSFVNSWAGELESYLGVSRSNLLKDIKKCWASFFTPRAIFYCFEKKLQKTKASVAVIIQKMVCSEVSGVCFTAHPITKNRKKIVIEAGFGSGGVITNGDVIPDTYVICKKTGKISIININKQTSMVKITNNSNKKIIISKCKQKRQKLTNKQILRLVDICKNIENYYKQPQDIEWVFSNNGFYIVQSRPITTLIRN